MCTCGPFPIQTAVLAPTTADDLFSYRALGVSRQYSQEERASLLPPQSHKVLDSDFLHKSLLTPTPGLDVLTLDYKKNQYVKIKTGEF